MTQAHQDRSFTEKLLPTQHDAVAPDGSLVRLLLSLAGGSMAHPASGGHTKALMPVMARPTISVFISRVPS